MTLSESYVEDAYRALPREGASHAIWLAECALELNPTNEDKQKVLELSSYISDESLADAIEGSASEIRRAMALLDAGELSAEEWVLIISDISGAYAIQRFAIRQNRLVTTFVLTEIMDRLESATKGFTDPAFRRNLTEVRRKNPNPLPPPLEFSTTPKG